MIKLNIGAGFEIKPTDQGWVNIDGNANEGINMVVNLSEEALPFPNKSVDHVLAKNIIEHISRHKQIEFITELYRVLKVGGTITIEMPNLKCIAESYLGIRETGDPNLDWLDAAAFIFGAQEDEFGCHRWIYDIPSITKLLQDIGFFVYYSGEIRGTNLICKAIKTNHKIAIGAMIDCAISNSYYIIESKVTPEAIAFAVKLANYNRVFCYGDFPEFEHENIIVIRDKQNASMCAMFRSLGLITDQNVTTSGFLPSIKLGVDCDINQEVRSITSYGSGVFIWAGGGLGDIIQQYLSKLEPGGFPSSSKIDTEWFRRLEDFKRVNPDIPVSLVIQSPNSYVANLFKHHPYIDKVHTPEWETPYDKSFEKDVDSYEGMVHIRHVHDFNDYEPVDTAIYLSDDDRAVMVNLPEQYIAMHPFAGNPERRVLPVTMFADIAIQLAEFMPVVVLGKSRQNDEEECFPIKKHNNILNLVNRVNARVSTVIAQNAYRFIGLHSSMILAAWEGNVKSLCIIPEIHDTGIPYSEYIKTETSTTWGLHQYSCKTIMVKSKFDKIPYEEILEWIRS